MSITADDVALFGTAGVLLVVYTVQLAKDWGMPSGWGKRAASVAALLVAVAWAVKAAYPDTGPYIQVPVVALLLYVAATGAYNLLQKDNKAK